MDGVVPFQTTEGETRKPSSKDKCDCPLDGCVKTEICNKVQTASLSL